MNNPHNAAARPNHAAPNPLGQERDVRDRATDAVRDVGRWGAGRDLYLARTVTALLATGLPDLTERATRMRDCSTSWVTFATPSGKSSRMAPAACQDKLCPVCVSYRTRAVRAFVDARVAAGDDVRFVTLTQPVRAGEAAEDGRKRLLRSWTRFWRSEKRRGECFYMRGGLRKVEVTWSARHQGWHWHLHVLFVGRFYPHHLLVRDWSRAADEGRDLSVRVNDAEDAVAEIAKYVCKVGTLPRERVPEWARACQGTRDLQRFGTWFNAEMPDEPDAPEEEQEAMVRASDVQRLAYGSGSLGREEGEAVQRLMAAVGGKPSVRAWRAWAATVVREWQQGVAKLEAAAKRREKGRRLRAARKSRAG